MHAYIHIHTYTHTHTKHTHTHIQGEGTAAAHAGNSIEIRAEYWHEGILAGYGPPATTYIAHPLPPADGGERDVLFFCHRGYQPADFQNLRHLFDLFQMRSFP